MSSKPKILADENIPKSTIQALRSSGYDVVPVWEVKPGLSDDQIIELSIRDQRIIITFDKDFGRLALTNPNIPDVVLMRIPPENPEYITHRILSALEAVGDPYGKLVIVRRKIVKIIPLR
ncbi:MAG: DUF5615 family PIN-like protein [Desulfurococcales archaeon]|nr:DUF5615 family PIN-like protein [Desulfurococcales archaeon]